MIEIQTAKELAEATLRETEKADLLIMAAAVADYRPTRLSTKKVKKSQGGISAIELETTPDILQEIAERKIKGGSGPQLAVGFAAETENLFENARIKLEEKGLDLIAANDVSRVDAGIGADQNQITLIWKDGNSREIPLMDKSDLSEILIEECVRLM
jgi:phosphopantothenoylcysteine decarboxylase/phosphopantothenate--cysteine ligase